MTSCVEASSTNLMSKDAPNCEMGCQGIVVLNVISATTKIVSSNPASGDIYSIQHYVIKFVSDLK
jgi:hypothetical protein